MAAVWRRHHGRISRPLGLQTDPVSPFPLVSVEPPNPQLSAPVALITGGGGALAQALNRELRSQGWQVSAPLRQEMDVTCASQVAQVIGSLSRLDLLVHSAGFVRDTPLARMSAADFADVLQVHLKGAFLTAQAALKSMVRQRTGHLVFIGSYSAFTGPVGQANYAAAKAGLVSLAQSLAVEYGQRNIRVNCVLPGFLDTPMTRHLLEKNRPQIEATHALGRLNTPSEAARFIAFLHSLENVSGQVFQLDSRIRRWA